MHATMEAQLATHEDADLILKLYDMRREPLLRQARKWLIFEFNPATAEEFFAVLQPSTSDENAYYRQVVSYWEMAASLVLHGTINADLFLDTSGEGIFILAKFHGFRDAVQAKTGRPFMRNTAKLVEKYPVAGELYHRMVQSVQARQR